MLSKLAQFYFRLDLRSLGLFRILVAILLLVDCMQRWPDIEAFYASAGVFAGIDRLVGPLSLLDVFQTVPQAQAFFVFAAICYVLFLVGYRTRLFHILSFICFVSIVNRNLLVRAGDDFVLAVMLMWTLFLPLGARFSIDALHARRSSDDNLSGYNLAAFCVVAQIGIIYFCTAFSKSGATWSDGTAIYYALQLDQFTDGLGHFVGRLPLFVLKPATWVTLGVEFLALPMMLSPFLQPYLRRIIIVALCALHVGIALCTNLDLFALKMMATFVLLFRTEDWELISRAAASLGSIARRRFRNVSSSLKKTWRRVSDLFQNKIATTREPTAADPGIVASAKYGLFDRVLNYGIQASILLIFVALLIENYNSNLRSRLGSARLPQLPLMRSLIGQTQLIQRWDLFAPDPTRDNGWWVIDSITEGGWRLDPLTGQEPTFAKPPDLASRHNRYWRKYLSRLWLKKNSQYRPGFARYITTVNHRQFPPGTRLKRFTMNYVPERTRAPDDSAIPRAEPVMLFSWDCFGRDATTPKANDVGSDDPVSGREL